MASAKFLMGRAEACATLARETEDESCRERCLRLEQVYLRLATSEGERTDSADETKAFAS